MGKIPYYVYKKTGSRNNNYRVPCNLRYIYEELEASRAMFTPYSDQ